MKKMKQTLATLVFTAVGAGICAVDTAAAAEVVVSQQTLDVASALLSPRVAPALAEFQKYTSILEQVKIEEGEDLTTYTFKGVKLIGGDIACGSGQLTITKSYLPQFGTGVMVPSYSAEASGSETCSR